MYPPPRGHDGHSSSSSRLHQYLPPHHQQQQQQEQDHEREQQEQVMWRRHDSPTGYHGNAGMSTRHDTPTRKLHHQLSRELIENPMAESASSCVSARTNVTPQISIQDTSQGGPSLRPVPHSAPVSRQISEQPPRRPRLVHTLSRSQSYKQYIKKPLEEFFGVNDETEVSSYQRWMERRKRMLSKRCGQLKKEYCQCPASDAESVGVISGTLPHIRDPFTKPWLRDQLSVSTDVPDSASATSSIGASSKVLHPAMSARRRKDSVAKMTWDGLNFIASTIAKKNAAKRSHTASDLHTSASIPRVGRPTTQRLHSYAPTTTTIDESMFYDDAPNVTFTQQQSISEEPVDHLVDDVFFDKTPTPEVTMRVAPPPFPSRKPDASPDDESEGGFTKLHEFHGISQDDGKRGWRRSPPPPGKSVVPHQAPVDTRDGPEVGFKRIWTRLLDRAFDNSDRRQYGMGIVGRFLRRKFKKDNITSDVKDQLDDIDDHRPYFTYWLTTVQLLIFIISMSVYGFGPIGFEQTERQNLVLMTSLSLQQVAYFEPSNFWIGPRPADLIHLGAKYTPCMRRDKNIYHEIDHERELERDTACCIRNDRSGCVQFPADKCSELLSSWKKWTPVKPGPDSRTSGSVCGQDPSYCEDPPSVVPYRWPDDITQWPVCKKTITKALEHAVSDHMSCEVIGHPCCYGINGQCKITTKEYCDFVKGYFHEEAFLCSQVSCLADVCGMIPFHDPSIPDQFYRLWTSLFLHAGIFHLAISIIVQFFIMRDLEKLAGPLRIGIIYIMSGIAGNLASAIFVPYRAEVGPAGSQFGLLACLFVEVIHCWQMLQRPGRALLGLMCVVVVLFIIGLLPWVDNYSHLFGFIFGFLLSFALLPFVSFGTYDRTTKIIMIWVCLLVVISLFFGLVILFYVHPIYECDFCKYINCIPFTKDICADQDIKIVRTLKEL